MRNGANMKYSFLYKKLCTVTLNGSKMQKNTSLSDDFMQHLSFHFTPGSTEMHGITEEILLFLLIEINGMKHP